LGLAAAVLAPPFVLIVKQPDLGTALVLLPVLVLLLVGAGIRLRLLGGVAVAGLSAMPVSWFALTEYQRERLVVSLEPFREPLGRLAAVGATALLAAETLINLGMVTGLLPIVGIPLPMMSYGGSSLVVSMMALGLLLSVRMRQFA